MYYDSALGEFGVVYQGTLKNWKDDMINLVAIKTLKGLIKSQFTSKIEEASIPGMFSSSDLKLLAEESQIMAKFDHPNVMKLIGVAISQAHQTLFVVMPFMAQGSLLSYLKKYRAELTVDDEEMPDQVR